MNFLPIAVSLALGVYTSQFLNIALIALVALSAILLSLFTVRGKHKFDIIFIILSFTVGNLLYSIGSSPKDNALYADNYVQLNGCIYSLPYDSYGTNRYEIYSSELEYRGETVPFKNKVIVYSDENFNCGDSVSVFGKLRLITANSDDIFSSKNYFAAHDIYCKMTAITMEKSEKEYTYFSPNYFVNKIKSNFTEIINAHYEGDVAAAMIAVITGNKHFFSESYTPVLKYTGTKHLFYPTFIHISLISLFIGLFSSIVPRRFRDITLVVLLTLYMLFSGTASSVKAGAVLVIMILSKHLLGHGKYLNSLYLFITLAILAEPMILFDAAFVYSVASSIVIHVFSPIMQSNNPIKRYLWKYFIFTIALSPLTLYLFGRISVYSLIASFIFMPLLGFILVTSPLFLINLATNTVFPFAIITERFISVLLHIPILIDKLPFYSITFAKPSIVFIIAFYLIPAAFWFAKHERSNQKLICIVIAAGLFTSIFTAYMDDYNKIKLEFIDVGQGDATLIHHSKHGNIIIDGGGSAEYSQYDIGENIFVPYLTEHGIARIDAAFVSHYHKDHTQGIIAALKYLNVRNIYLPDNMPESKIRLEIEQVAAEKGTKVWYISKPTSIRVGDIYINAIPPSPSLSNSDDENDTSMYLEVKFGKFNAVFTGDMSSQSEAELLSHGVVNDAEVLKVAHHGSQTSSSQEMLDAVSPEYALIGVSEGNEYGHPHSDVLKRLKDTEVYRTDLHGDIVIKSDDMANISVKVGKR